MFVFDRRDIRAIDRVGKTPVSLVDDQSESVALKFVLQKDDRLCDNGTLLCILGNDDQSCFCIRKRIGKRHGSGLPVSGDEPRYSQTEISPLFFEHTNYGDFVYWIPECKVQNVF